MRLQILRPHKVHTSSAPTKKKKTLLAFIIQWNINGFYRHLEKLHLILSSNKPSVICLQETNLKEKQNAKLKNYKCYNKNRNIADRASGGVATFVSQVYDSQEIPLITDLEAVAVSINFDRKITIVNIYYPNSTVLNSQNLQNIIDQITPPYIILGDMNAHNIIWGSEETDSRGKIVENLLNDNNLILLNTGEKTRFNAYNGKLSAIDLAFCDITTAAHTNWETFDYLYGSDHFPVKVEYGNKRDLEHHSQPKWNLKEANWSLFAHHLEENFDADLQLENINNMVEYLERKILGAAEHSIKKITTFSGKKSVPWWNQQCKEAIRRSKHAFNVLKKHNTEENLIEFKRLRAKTRYIMKQSKKKSWREFVNKIDSSTSTSEVWSKIRKINGTSTNYHIMSLEDKNKQISKDGQEISETLADYFESTSSDANHNKQFLTHKQNVEKSKIQHNINDSHPINSPITMIELENALHSCGDSSPGPDNIPYSFLQNLPASVKSYLLTTYNQVWKSHKFPRRWSQAIVIPILKPNRQKNLPTSYRPISLTCTMCKILERIINKRLSYFIEKENLLCKTQNGFRKGRSTIDNIVALESDIHEAFATNQHVLAVFFDLDKAYDMVWRRSILDRMKKWGLEGNVVSFVENFLQERTFRVRANGTLSRDRTLRNGVPQGSILSVTLFLIAINDVFDNITSPIKTTMYADDLLIYIKGKDRTVLQKLIQCAIDKLAASTQASGFKFSPSKTKYIFFSRRSKFTADLQLNGTKLELVNSIRFLGIIFDQHLNWKEHIHSLQLKCNQVLDLLKTLASYHWGADTNHLLHIYRSLIRSRIEYGLIAYSTASHRLLKTVNTIENTALRIALGAFRTSPTESLHCLANELPLTYRVKQLTLQYAAKISPTKEHPNYNITFSNRYQQIYSHKSCQPPLYERLNRILSELNIDFPTNFFTPNCHYFPWASPQPQLNINMAHFKKSDIIPCLARNEFNNICDQYQNYNFVFTDASKSEDGVGCAVVHQDKIRQYHLSNLNSNYTGELYAILQAVEHTSKNQERKHVVCTDSLSSIQAIKELYPIHPLAQAIKQKLSLLPNQPTFMFVPSHIGIYGNESADQAAKQAVQNPERCITEDQVTQSDFKKHIKEIVWRQWENKWLSGEAKLKEIKPSTKLRLPMPKDRRSQVIISRLRIGHTYLTHSYLINRQDPPVCEECQTALTTRHLLLKCQKLRQFRPFGDNETLQNLLGPETPQIEKVLRMINQAKLPHMI